MTHLILPSMSDNEIEAELRDSRRMIEAKLGEPAEFLYYPNGDVDERALAMVRRHYRAAVTCNPQPRLDPYLMPDMHLPRGVLALAWKLNHPPLPEPEGTRRPDASSRTTSVPEHRPAR